MIRATEIVIIAKVQNQASGQLRRLARDVGSLGKASELNRRIQQGEMRMLQQNARQASTGARFRQQQLRQSERLLQLDREQNVNLTQRMRLQQRIAVTADPQRRLILERQIAATYQRQNVLQARRRLYEAEAVHYGEAYNRQLRIQAAQMKELEAEQANMLRMQKAQAAGGRFQAAGRTISHIGRAATFGGLLSTAGFAAASKSFADFSSLSTKAATQIQDNADKGVDAVIASGHRLEQAVMEQMKIFPASQTEMADALYQLYSSMDIGEKRGVNLLKRVNQLAVAMGSDLPTATNVAITTLNNFQSDGRGVIGTFDDMAAIIRLGRMELTDFDEMMNSVAPAAKGAGYSLREMGGAMALITRLMPSQQRAATGLARLIDIFNNRDFQMGMAKLHKPILDANNNLLSFEEIIRRIASLKPTGPGLQNFIQNITALGRGQGRGVQGTIQARRALVLLVKNYQQLHQLQGDINESQGEFNKRLQAMRQSPGVQWAIFVNQMRLLAIEIGRDAIPAIVKLQGWIKGLIARWHELSPGTRQAIVYFTALAGVFALVGGPILTLIGSLVSLYGTLKVLSILLGAGGATGAAGLLGRMAGLLALMGELAAIGVITISVVIALKWVTSKMPPWAQRIFNYSGMDALHDLGRAFGIGGGGGGDKSLRTGKTVTGDTPFFNPNAKIPGARTKASRQMLKDIRDAKDPVAQLQKRLDESAKSTWNNVKAGEAYKRAMQLVQSQLDGTDTSLKQYNKDMKQWHEGMVQAVKSAHEQYQQIVSQAVDNMVSKYNELKQANESAFGTLFQGPILTGESFQEAQDWGISPTIGIINQDLAGQIKAFNKWKGDLNALAKRGAPKQLVQELTQLGPEAADRVEALRKASPRMFNNFLRLWKQKQRAITRATQQDFNQQLKMWESHGKNMGLKIIAGLETEQTGLSRTMRGILEKSFNGTLLSEIVAKAIRDFRANNPMPKAPKQTTTVNPTTGATTTTTRPRRTPISNMTLQQVNRALRHDVPRLRSLNQALITEAGWVTDPDSPGGIRITPEENAALKKLGRQRARVNARVRAERRRRRHLIHRGRAAASSATQGTAQNTSYGYQPMPQSAQYIQVNLHTNEPTVVAARKAGFIVANKARRV